jgi:hypothetical protein
MSYVHREYKDYKVTETFAVLDIDYKSLADFCNLDLILQSCLDFVYILLAVAH